VGALVGSPGGCSATSTKPTSESTSSPRSSNSGNPGARKIAQVGLLGDESGRLKFVKWASADLPELEEGEAYRFESVVTDEYLGRFSVSCNSATAISLSGDVVAASDGSVVVVGSIVDIQVGSGLIKRCGADDCTRVLRNGRCAEHGQRDGKFDLRIKAILDDGERSVSALFDAAATEAVTGISLGDATDMAMTRSRRTWSLRNQRAAARPAVPADRE
jgi:ssDNA-binding replication factor A large subunit